MAVLPCLPRGHRRDFSPKREKSADPYAQSSRPSTSTSFRTVCFGSAPGPAASFLPPIGRALVTKMQQQRGRAAVVKIPPAAAVKNMAPVIAASAPLEDVVYRALGGLIKIAVVRVLRISVGALVPADAFAEDRSWHIRIHETDHSSAFRGWRPCPRTGRIAPSAPRFAAPPPRRGPPSSPRWRRAARCPRTPHPVRSTDGRRTGTPCTETTAWRFARRARDKSSAIHLPEFDGF